MYLVTIPDGTVTSYEGLYVGDERYDTVWIKVIGAR